MLRRKLAAIVAAAVMMSAGSSAWAVSIGLNFISDRNTGAAIGAAESAGVGGFAQINWNNTTPQPSGGVAIGSTANIASPVAGAIVDSTGAATGVTVNWNGNNTWTTNNDTGNPDNKLMNAYLDTSGGKDQAVVSFINVPYAYYDVVAYFGSDGNDRAGTITDGSTTYSYNTHSQQGGGFPGAYLLTTDTGGGNPDANFALFQGHSAEDVTITLNRGTVNSGLHGVQIVEKTTGLVLSGSMRNDSGKLAGTAALIDLASGIPTGQPVNWEIQVFGAVEEGGLRTEWFHAPTPARDTRVEVDAFLATNPTPSVPEFRSTIAFDGPTGSFPFPPEVAAGGIATGTSRVVRYSGEIFIPFAGTYQFKDGVDQSTLLRIDGQTLINDSQWTGFNGTGGDGSDIVSTTFDVAAGGEWLPIEFIMGEEGGSDHAALYWDLGGLLPFPATDGDAADVAALIDGMFLRSALLEQTLSGSGEVDGVFMDADGNMLTFDQAKTYQLTVSFPTFADFVTTDVQNVPEPATGLLALLGVAALGSRRRRRSAA